MMVVHITQDLMMSSNASSASRDAGHRFKFVSTWERAAHFIAEEDVKFLLIDLQTPNLDVAEIAAGIADLKDAPKTIAYAQHVEVDLLVQANKAQFDKVLTRGQAHHGLAEILNG